MIIKRFWWPVHTAIEQYEHSVSPYEIARYYALMGDRDHTFEGLEKAYAERSGRIEYTKERRLF